MNRKELERKLIEVTQERNILKELISIDCQDRINTLVGKINSVAIENIELKIDSLIEENKKLRKTNMELVDEIAELKYAKRKYNKNKNRIKPQEYNIFRKEILKRDNYTCKNCGSKEKLQVHHIKSRKEFPELIMDKDNCITLCIRCHAETDNYFC